MTVGGRKCEFVAKRSPKRCPTHPGALLREDILPALKLSKTAVAEALGMRELIRQAYLFSAGILTRPLVERTGTIYYLCNNPTSIDDWHAGWPRKSQPKFGILLDLVMPSESDEERKAIEELLHKLVHSDPIGGSLNATTRSDGSRGSAVGNELNEPDKADAISAFATKCLDGLTKCSINVLGLPGEQTH